MNSSEKPQVVWHQATLQRADRERLAGHRSCVVWFTGLSGSGKSTIANLVDAQLYRRGVRSYVLDGDNVRHGLNATPQLLQAEFGSELAARFGLGFGPADRQENIRRIGQVARLFCDAGVIVLAALVSPYRANRDSVRAMLAPGDFVEVFVDTPLDVCQQRDPKGLYQQALAGKIRNFTGIDAPYETPLHPEIHLDAGRQTPDVLAEQVVNFLRTSGKIAAS